MAAKPILCRLSATGLTLAAIVLAAGRAFSQDAAPSTSPPPLQDAPSSPPAVPEYQDPLPEYETEIILKDRRRVSGKLVEVTSESVVLAISGIPTVFKLDGIEGIRALPTVEERYDDLRAAITDDDIDGLLRLSEWVRAKGYLTLALRDVDLVLKQEPANRAALDMRTIIIEQMKVSALKPVPKPVFTPPKPKAAGDPEPAPIPRVRGASAQFPLLTDEQINLIRVLEVDLRDPPSMIVKRETIQKFLDTYQGTVVEGRGAVPVTPEAREQFFRMRPPQVLAWFFDVRARDLYPEVQVLENPRSMRLFRDNINRTWLVNSCATSKCHGGDDAGRFYLWNKSQSSDRAAYTNWVITDSFRTSAGLPLIDVKDPARSPLLQFGLPRDQAVIKHPQVEGGGRRWQPVFDGVEDRRFRAAVDWIQSLYPNRSPYPITYTPPVPAGFAETQGAPESPEIAPMPPR